MHQDLDQTALLVSAFVVAFFALPLVLAWLEQSPKAPRADSSRADHPAAGSKRQPE